MRGTVVTPVEVRSPGEIRGEDGGLYTYTAARVHKGAALAAGAAVDFIALGREARDVYPLNAATSAGAVSPSAAPAKSVPAKAGKPFNYFLGGLWKNYARFKGRARRAEYFGYNLFWALFLMLCVIADALVSTVYFGMYAGSEEAFAPILSTIYFTVTLVPGAAITVRRLHDQNTSGWLYLIMFAPYVGGMILFILMFNDSRREPNRHGESPKYGAAPGADRFG